MRIFGAAVLATSLLVTNAFAETPLPAGKPAGVKKAQIANNTLMLIGGLGFVGLGIGLAASGSGGGPTAFATTTTSTSTTGTSSIGTP